MPAADHQPFFADPKPQSIQFGAPPINHFLPNPPELRTNRAAPIRHQPPASSALQAIPSGACRAYHPPQPTLFSNKSPVTFCFHCGSRKLENFFRMARKGNSENPHCRHETQTNLHFVVRCEKIRDMNGSNRQKCAADFPYFSDDVLEEVPQGNPSFIHKSEGLRDEWCRREIAKRNPCAFPAPATSTHPPGPVKKKPSITPPAGDRRPRCQHLGLVN